MVTVKHGVEQEEQFLHRMLLILTLFLFIVVVGLGLMGYRRLTGQAIISQESALLRPFSPHLSRDVLKTLRQKHEFTLGDVTPLWLVKPATVASILKE